MAKYNTVQYNLKRAQSPKSTISICRGFVRQQVVEQVVCVHHPD